MSKTVESELDRLRREVEELRDDRERLVAALERDEQAISDLRYELIDGLRPAESEPEAQYRKLVRVVHETVLEATPRGAVIAVLSKGDDELLRFQGRSGWHFPRQADGTYAGHHPENDLTSIAQLAVLRAEGAEFLAVPASAHYWLDHCGGFAHHLLSRYEKVIDSDACVIFDLRRRAARPLDLHGHLEELMDQFRSRFGRSPVVLDLHPGITLQAELPGETVFEPLDADRPCYIDESIDIVVVARGHEEAFGEALRLASAAVVTISDGDGRDGEPTVHWKRGRSTGGWQTVSIVIPVRNAVQHTRACLVSLRETLPAGIDVEIIVVDDESTDGTESFLVEAAAEDPRIRVFRNEKNLGFLGSSNLGAENASGEVLIFLNNDTILLPGWLEPLLRVLARPGAGAVGGRLLYPDLRLQEAGGLVFRDASAAKFGYGENDPEGAIFNYVREVDYVSGCLLATPRLLFEEIGRFDESFAPGFYEDTDYCFAVRAHGRRVFYQPESTIIHVEGGTAGTDVTEGMKRYQVQNEAKFREKWVAALAAQPKRPAPVLGRAHLHLLRARDLREEVPA